MASDPLPPVPPLTLLPQRFAICQLPIPTWPEFSREDGFLSLTSTASEHSLVCEWERRPRETPTAGPWRAWVVKGPLSFEAVGILARLAAPLAEAGLSIFVISTFDTDYLLVRETDLDAARQALVAAGHELGAGA